MEDMLTVDAFLEAEMLHEDHMDVMLEEVEARELHDMIDESIANNLFYDEDDYLSEEGEE